MLPVPMNTNTHAINTPTMEIAKIVGYGNIILLSDNKLTFSLPLKLGTVWDQNFEYADHLVYTTEILLVNFAHMSTNETHCNK